MPEGPSLAILKEALQQFAAKKIVSANGNAKIDMPFLPGKKIKDIKTWGKQLFILLNDGALRIHLLLWGSYSFNEQTKPDKSLRLHLQFANGDVYFYTCSVKIVDENMLQDYDWAADVMSDAWDAAKARKKLRAKPDMLVCDALLDQDIFAGSGNIFKNEVLYRIKVHPESRVGNLPPKKLKELVDETRNYAFDFFKWKKAFVLKKNWLAHTKKTCLRCNLPLIKRYLGVTNRRTFYCEGCQKLY